MSMKSIRARASRLAADAQILAKAFPAAQHYIADNWTRLRKARAANKATLSAEEFGVNTLPILPFPARRRSQSARHPRNDRPLRLLPNLGSSHHRQPDNPSVRVFSPIFLDPSDQSLSASSTSYTGNLPNWRRRTPRRGYRKIAPAWCGGWWSRNQRSDRRHGMVDHTWH